jgi:hypothetical protein
MIAIEGVCDPDEVAQGIGKVVSNKESAADRVICNDSVFAMNDTFLEVCSPEFGLRGFGGIFGLGMVGLAYPGFLALSGFLSEMRAGDSGAWVTAFGLVVFTGMIAFCWSIVRQDWFTQRDWPVRFNRKTRMIYVARPWWMGGFFSMSWDDAVVRLVDDKRLDGTNRTLGFADIDPATGKFRGVRRGIGTVTDFFGGLFTLMAHAKEVRGPNFDWKRRFFRNIAEAGLPTETVDEEHMWFEYIRVYMEDDWKRLPEPYFYVSRRASLIDCLKHWFCYYDLKRSRERGHDYSKQLAKIIGLSPIWLLLAINRYIAMLTSREPKWPEEVRRACGES